MITLVLKEYSSNRKAQAYCDKISQEVNARWPLASLSVNKVDEGCHQVELTGDFGPSIYLPVLYR